MNPMDLECPKIRQHLALYAGRDLEAPLCAEVERHLADCAACRAELAHCDTARGRIGVLGAETARSLESVDLWPALGERWAKESASARSAAAIAGESPRPDSRASGSRRIWIPLALAAAAALVVALQWKSAPPTPLAPPISLAVDPSVPANAPAAPALVTQSNEILRRAAPGEERLRDSSSPLGLPLRPWPGRGLQQTPNSLAGDNDLR